MTNPAAWHPDPTSAHEYRWWDGTRWTEHVADGGQASVDPLPGVSEPGAAAAESAGPDDQEAGSSVRDGASGPDAGEDAAAPTAAWQQPEAADPYTTSEMTPERPAEPSWQQPEQGWQQPAGQAGGGGAGGQSPTWQQEPAWSQPGGGQRTSTGTNGVAIAALVIGIIAILISWIPILGALAGILALILGFVGRGKFKKDPAAGGNGPAITGIVTGIVATLISIAITIAIFTFGFAFFETYEDCIERGGTPEECEQELERDFMDRFGQ